MSITSNESGTLYELSGITVNESGTLYELDTVHANESGTLQEIFSRGYKNNVTYTLPASNRSAEWNEDGTVITFSSDFENSGTSDVTLVKDIVITLTEDTVVSFEVNYGYSSDWYGRMRADTPTYYPFGESGVARGEIVSPAIATTGSSSGVSYGTPSSCTVTLSAGTYTLSGCYYQYGGSASYTYCTGTFTISFAKA